MSLSARSTRALALAVSACLVMPVVQGQAPATAPAPAAAPAKAPTPAGKTFSQQELDELLAPIALYPDALLAQVLMASTYPLEVVEAARWQKSNAALKDKALEEALTKQSWDPSVKSLTAVPQVLTMMNEKLDWTQKLGDAFLAQQGDVMATAQSLRGKAQAAGNLKSTPEQIVKTEVVEQKTVYIIEPAKPEVVYVPTYNPAVIYGPWWYGYPPPYYYYPPGYVAGGAFWFGTGIIVGGAIWGGCHWGRNEVNINVNKYNSFNRTNISNNNFQHNAEHRKGVSYGNQAAAQKYNRGGDAKAAQSREQFRGHAEQGRGELKSMDKGQLNDRVSQADRAGAGNRDAGNRAAQANTRDLGSRGSAGTGSRDLGGGASTRQGGGGGGFSGASSGASTRAASTRGSASRASMGGGGGARAGGGGGRRR
ncbi:MAG: DUF3300 domain-containing protein [Betaproteobacteria bacterium]|nr:DUF3300 domain-containing protein [Betaproteobacteria bacterium]